MPLDEREDILAARGIRKHHFASMQKKSLQTGTSERQVVRQRKHVQQNLIRAYRRNRSRHFGIVNVIIVGPRDQLGHAGGAAGKLEQRRVLGIDSDTLEIACGACAFSLDQLGQR